MTMDTDHHTTDTADNSLAIATWMLSERWPCGFMRYNLLKRWDRGRQLRRPRLFRHLGRSSLAEARGLATVANVSANMQHIGSGAIAFGFGEQCVHSALV